MWDAPVLNLIHLLLFGIAIKANKKQIRSLWKGFNKQITKTKRTEFLIHLVLDFVVNNKEHINY